MAKKSLGFVELEWVCPTCNTRNPGSSRTCQGCGSPQPPDVKFVAPTQANIVKDDAVARKASAGPDIHCPYCDARNPAGAKVCKQCGGDLTKAQARTAGEVVANFTTKGPEVVKCTACGTENPTNLRNCKNCGAPLPTAAAPAVTQKPQNSRGSGCLWIAIGAVVLLVIAAAVFMFSGSERTAVVGTVSDTRWVRTIQIMDLQPVRYTAWLDQIPADATIGACTEEVRAEVDEPIANSREVCGTPYAIDQGDGSAQVFVDCVYQILEQRCEYTVREWRPVDVVTEEGAGFSPSWPSLTSGQREGERDEEYACVFQASDNTYIYKARSFAEYQSCTPGSTWNLEVNEAGTVLSAIPAE